MTFGLVLAHNPVDRRSFQFGSVAISRRRFEATLWLMPQVRSILCSWHSSFLIEAPIVRLPEPLLSMLDADFDVEKLAGRTDTITMVDSSAKGTEGNETGEHEPKTEDEPKTRKRLHSLYSLIYR